MSKQYEEGYWDERALSKGWPQHVLNHEVNDKNFWERKDGLGRIDLSLLHKDSTVFVDIGCGPGRAAKTIAPLVKDYYGVDISQEMLNKAKSFFKGVENVHFVKTNGMDLRAFKDNSVDIVFMCLVFLHVTKEIRDAYFKEVHRILKPGGIFYALHLPKNKIYPAPMTEVDVDALAGPFDIIQKRDEITHYYTLVLRKNETV